MDCREYLQVTTLADTTSVDGRRLCLNHGKEQSTNEKYIPCHNRGNLRESILTGNYGNKHLNR